MKNYLEHKIVQEELFPGVPITFVLTPGKPMVRFMTVVNSGYYLAPKNKHELPHLLEHLSFEGSTTYPSGKVASIELESASVYQNAYTNDEFNWYTFDGPHESIELMQKHAIAQLFEPLFNEKAIEQQKNVIHNELNRFKSDDPTHMMETLDSVLWPDVTANIVKRLNDLPKISRTEIVKYYREKYVLRNMHFIITGDLDKSTVTRIESTLKNSLKNKPLGKYQPYEPKKDRIAKKNIYIIPSITKDVTIFWLRFYIPNYDFPERSKRSMLKEYLAVGLGSIMQRDLREAGLTYGIRMTNIHDAEHSGIGFSDKVPDEKVLLLIEQIMIYLRDVADGKIDETAFNRAKGQVLNEKESMFQTSADFLGWHTYELRRREKPDKPEDWYEKMEQMKPEDLTAVAKRYLSDLESHWLMIVSTSSKDLKASDLKKVVNKYRRK